MAINIRKTSETASKMTLAWDPVPGAAAGYRGRDVTVEKWTQTQQTQMTFAKGASVEIEALGIADSGVYPPLVEPPPPPPSSPLHRMSRRLSSHFDHVRNTYVGTKWATPEYVGTPWPNGGGMFEIATPHGDGLKFRCTQDMQMEWNANAKGLMGEWQHNLGWVGEEHVWEGAIYVPAAGNPQGFASGFYAGIVLLQPANTTGGTQGSTNGHMLSMQPDGRLCFMVRSGNVPHADLKFTTQSPVALDTWHPFRWEIKHSYGSDGYQRGWIGAEKVVDRTGPTLWSNETIWSSVLQIYTTRWETTLNEFWFANVRLS